METEWLDADAAASSLHITRATLYKLIRQGCLAARKNGGRWSVSRRHIEDLFAASDVAVAPERSAGP
jgi:excisionase family DNA binding protein